MKAPTYLIPTLLLTLFVAACGQEAARPDAPHAAEHAGETPAHDATAAEMAGGVQVVEVTVGPLGFSPKAIALREGVPARIVFNRTAAGGCIDQVQIPDFGVEKTNLPLNEPVAVEFTPDESGRFTFVCGMDMLEGTLLVQT